MFIREMGKERSPMRLAAGIIVLLAALVAAEPWTPGAHVGWGTTLVAGVGIIVVVGVVRVWLRNRQRRWSMDMRDSALW
mgnify:CR=1 FL=1